MPTREELKEKVKLLPPSPGVYMMHDKTGKIIYVGKSKCLRNRVASYFQPLHRLSPKTAKLSERIDDFECIYTSTETEALILENELIKRHMPKYNIKLKDAKTYPYIRLSSEYGRPVITMTRRRKDDKAKYFGPYTSGIAANDIIKAASKAFRLPRCKKVLEPGKVVGRPCLYYHTGTCMGMCRGEITAEEFRDLYARIERFLKGDFEGLLAELKENMMKAAQEMRFEAAAMYRETGCDLVMAGRGTYGRPYLFAEIDSYFSGEPFTPPTAEEKLRIMYHQAELTVKFKGERTAMSECRRQCAFYLRGIPSAAKFRNKCGTLTSLDDLRRLIDEIENVL